ncbi:hypothetical protein FD754_000804, partial [Muntiacus muntjak]
GWSQDLFCLLQRALSKEVKEPVGAGQFGNKQYYIPEEKNELEVANEREIDYEVGDIPTEREAWIRKNKDSNEKWREETKRKSEDFYSKEKLLREESNRELLAPPVQTQMKAHASAPFFGKQEPFVAPSSAGKSFQPGSWMPQDGKSRNQ